MYPWLFLFYVNKMLFLISRSWGGFFIVFLRKDHYLPKYITLLTCKQPDLVDTTLIWLIKKLKYKPIKRSSEDFWVTCKQYNSCKFQKNIFNCRCCSGWTGWLAGASTRTWTGRWARYSATWPTATPGSSSRCSSTASATRSTARTASTACCARRSWTWATWTTWWSTAGSTRWPPTKLLRLTWNILIS